MDPIANIKEQLDKAKYILENNDRSMDESVTEQILDDASRLAELVVALDEWRRKGGFDPYIPMETDRNESVMRDNEWKWEASTESRIADAVIVNELLEKGEAE